MSEKQALSRTTNAFIVSLVLLNFSAHCKAETLPLTGGWDARNNQINVVDCTNSGTSPIRALITVLDKKGQQLASKPFIAKPQDTVRLHLHEIVKAKQPKGFNNKRRPSLNGKTGSYIIEASSTIETSDLPLYCGRLIYRKTESQRRKFVDYAAAETADGEIHLDLGQSASRTVYNSDNTLCDQDISTSSSGNWSSRWGSVYVSTNNEPAFHPCGANNMTARLVTQSAEACAVSWKSGKLGTTLRNADVSFMAPNLSSFNHIMVAPAYDTASIGRIGIAVFRDKLFVQYNATNSVGCAQSASLSSTTNLFPVNSSGGGVRLSQSIQSGRWYRAYSQIRKLSTGLEITGIVHNDALQQIGFVRQSFPMGCYPSWFNGLNNKWMVGFKGAYSNATLYLDDFVGRPARLQ